MTGKSAHCKLIKHMINTSKRVQDAIHDKRPVVALESTIISHGLPYPQNIEIALEIEKAVEHHGATPATIAILDGEVKVGLSHQEIEKLASPTSRIQKASMIDIAPVVSAKKNAATTVSATSTIAHRAGLSLFATGGIGGVHRGDSLDVSSDLQALETIPIAVVSAGPKSILDIPKTLERLETLGVLVLGYQSSECPGFYTPTSGLKLDHVADTPVEVAQILLERWKWGQKGVLVANPPLLDQSMDLDVVNTLIEEAIHVADKQGIGGKKLTPFLLNHLNSKSGGKTVAANKALVLNNAKVAAEIASAMAKLKVSEHD